MSGITGSVAGDIVGGNKITYNFGIEAFSPSNSRGFFQRALRNGVFQLRRSLLGIRAAKASEIDKLTKQVRRIWIDGKLGQSLAAGAAVPLACTEIPDDHLAARKSLPSSHSRYLETTSRYSIREAQERTGNSTLVLGKAGAGKTTAVLMLVKEALESLSDGDSKLIPIVFPLSNWSKRSRSFGEWLVSEMMAIYALGEDACRALLDDDRILLILDGADEVGADFGNLLDTIREFLLRHEMNCIVTCRTEAYLNADQKLNMRGVVEILLIDCDDVLEYVDRLGQEFKPVGELLRVNVKALEICRVPMMLNFLLSVANRPALLTELRSDQQVDKGTLLDIFFKHGFQFRNADWTTGETLRFLANLSVLAGSNMLGINRVDLRWIGDRWPDKIIDHKNFDSKSESRVNEDLLEKMPLDFQAKYGGDLLSKYRPNRLIRRLRKVESIARPLGMLLATTLLFEAFRSFDSHFSTSLEYHGKRWFLILLVWALMFWSVANPLSRGRGWTIGEGLSKYVFALATLLGLMFVAGLILWAGNWIAQNSLVLATLAALGSACVDVVLSWRAKKKSWIKRGSIIFSLSLFVLSMMRIVGAQADLSSLTQYLLVFCVWMFVNSIGGNFAVSLIYFFAIRGSGVIPWRVNRFMRVMTRAGILEQNERAFRFSHQEYYLYFQARSRYSFPHL